MLIIFIFILGAVIGSFLNVCIYRLPREESIVFPGSHCTHCNHKLYWHDNIPFFSYLILRGKCRFCARPIAFRYFLVEFLTAALLVTLYVFFGLSAKFFVWSVLTAALIASTFIDFEHQIIPDVITLPGIAVGLMASLLFPSIQGETVRSSSLLSSFIGMLAGGGSIYAMGVFGKLVFKKEAMGGGDVKLMAMAGAFLGWKLVILAFFIAPFFGSVVGVTVKIKQKKDIIPYGPYLSLALIVAILWGQRILGYLFFY
ncbi:MAG: prepilin peptidase [Candidatus Omnitrophica bacterium]|nr:prepilin peptidase [Candidatus Omnitrophota bacterium]